MVALGLRATFLAEDSPVLVCQQAMLAIPLACLARQACLARCPVPWVIPASQAEPVGHRVHNLWRPRYL